MDYAVGSLSDLITGSNTPNKPKVITKKWVKSPKAVPSNESTPRKKSKNNVQSTESNGAILSPSLSGEVSPKKSAKKRKIPSVEQAQEEITQEQPAVDGEQETPPKKTKRPKSNAERRIKKKDKPIVEKVEEDPEKLARTVYLGNIPITISKEKVKRFFKKYGDVETFRIRAVPVADLKTPKKVAAIKKEFHPDRKSVSGYLRFLNRDGAERAAANDGVLFHEHHLRIQLCDSKPKPDESKAIFVGNLNFKAEEEELWQFFEKCGPISSVRIVRDKVTGIGKGFAYVNFKSSDAVQLALEMEDVQFKDRELRIKPCNLGAAAKNKKKNKPKAITKAGKPKAPKAIKEETDGKSNSEGEVHIENKQFQGTKFAEKKKKKTLNKGLQQKKKLIKKLAPK